LTLKTGAIFGIAKYLKHGKQCESSFLSNAPHIWQHIPLFADT